MPTHAEKVAELSAELRAALLREVALTWADYNRTYFRGRLSAPVFALAEASSRLGRWLPGERTLELGLKLVLDQPWGTVLEVLKHEMAHQYVDEVLRAGHEAAHGPTFRRICEGLGIDAAAAGMPAPAIAEQEEGVLRRVARLLALAGSPNENEAQAAMDAARRLMLKYNVDAPRGGPRHYGYRHLGEPTGRVQEWQRVLAMILGQHFFVEVLWVQLYRPHDGKRGSVIEAVGTPANLELATYVHAFLTRTGEQLWEEYRRERRLEGRRDRLKYIAGVMRGFHEKLGASGREERQAGLIYAGDADLKRYLRTRHPRIRRTWLHDGAGSEAYASGREAGKGIVLHRPIDDRAPVQRGRLLASKNG